MSKKSKRARARQRHLDRRLPPSTGLTTAHTSTTTMQDSKALTSSEESPYVALSSRYRYVLPELRIIGIISGVLFFILIILSFVLR